MGLQASASRSLVEGLAAGGERLRGIVELQRRQLLEQAELLEEQERRLQASVSAQKGRQEAMVRSVVEALQAHLSDQVCLPFLRACWTQGLG